MKMYVVKEEEFQKLITVIELIKHRKSEGLSIHDPKRFEIDEMFRSFHLYVVNWIQEMQK